MIAPSRRTIQVKVMDDLRPVALTSAIMKVFKRVVLSHLQSLVADLLEPLQFAWGGGGGGGGSVRRCFACPT